MAEATVGQVTFRGNDLSRPASKQGGGVSARLHKITDASDGIDVELNVTPVSNPRKDFGLQGNPLGELKRMMAANAPGRIGVFLEDSEGQLHSPTATKTHGDGSESSETRGPNGTVIIRRSGSSSGSSSGSGSFGPGGIPDNNQGDGSSDASSSKYDAYRFDILPAGVKVRAIVCKVTDFVGEPKAVPFHFENVPLP